MEKKGRRSFVKESCLLGMGGLAGFPALLAAGEASTAGEAKPESIHSRWITSLLLGLNHENPETVRKLVKDRGQAHFDDLKLQEVLSPFVGKLEAFISFLEKEWGWTVGYDRENGVIIADENKDHCVCPLIQNKNADGLGALCYCSEGIAEKMFSFVAGRPVKAEVAQSILRGAPSCRYKVTLG